ncbi:hypothetical protein F4780DRAFT_721024 [Xylariomycetidae sp. FL0641]|nr:hypothetical protein F4780DRAFT_721024 [Xylariomycetidae sp. FL0641]
MDPPPPGQAHELHHLPPTNDDDGRDTAQGGGAGTNDGDTRSRDTGNIANTPTTPPQQAGPASPSPRSEKPKVRFSARAIEHQTAERPGSHDRRPRIRLPRPVLFRESSSNSLTDGDDDDDDDARDAEKTRSAQEAARRAQALANDTSNRASSLSADDAVGADFTASLQPPSPIDAPVRASWQVGDARLNSEAAALVRAHRQSVPAGKPARESYAEPARVSTGDSSPGDYAVTVNPRGGIFYQILQTYRQPAPEQEPELLQPKRAWSGSSSGTTTPTRRKWYQQPNDAVQSHETLSRLVGASTKLANPNEKGTSPEEFTPTRKGHKRSASDRIMSMMGMGQEDEARITQHVAGILQRQKYIIKMCRALICFGAPSHRLEEYLSTSAKVLEIDSQFLYIPGCMIISFDDVLTHTTEVKLVRTSQGINLGKLQDVHSIYKEVLHDVITLDEALSRLDELQKSKNRYPVWLNVIMYGLASAAVSCFFKARLIDMPVIFVLGTILGVLQLVVAPRSNTYSTVSEVSAAILITFLSRAIASINGGRLFCFSALVQGSIAMILPGYLILSAALELQSKAIIPGSIRMVYSIIYSLFLGYGITVGTALYGAMDRTATMQPGCANAPNPYYNFIWVPLYVFFALFTVQAKFSQMPAMMVIAFAGYVVNFWSSRLFAASAPIAYTFSAFAIGILANLYSRLRHGVAAAVLLPAVYLQVPGGLAASGAISGGLHTAAKLAHSDKSADPQDAQLNAIVFNVAATMIQVAIGVTVGLFLAALVVYPLGKRRSGLWTL